jgi:hypothetical protein
MKTGEVVVTTMLALAVGTLGGRAQQGPPGITPTAPLRQTFVSGAQVVIDDAQAVDVKADNDHFAGPMQQLRQASENLTAMASDDREKDIAAEMKDMIFQISSCHIQAIDGTSTDKCEAQVKAAEQRAMEVIGRHKEGGGWVEGAPV